MVFTSQMQSHLTLLRVCADTCRVTLYNYCIPMGGDHAKTEHVQRMLDCIESCKTAVEFLTRDSEHHQAICLLCAGICRDCADSCEAIADETMQRCAAICRQCAFACGRMAVSGEQKHTVAA